MNVFDMWKPRSVTINLATPSKVFVLVGNQSEMVQVEDIIYDARYAMSSATERYLNCLKVSRTVLTFKDYVGFDSEVFQNGIWFY